MRSLGLFTDPQQGAIFRDYLEGIGIPCQLVPEDGATTLWIIEEDDVPKARDELLGFRLNPEAPEYRQIATEAAARREVKMQTQLRSEMQQHRERSRNRPRRGSLWEIPVTVILVTACVIVTLWTSFGKDRLKTNPFLITEVNAEKRYVSRPILIEVRESWEVWRFVTPIFVHMDPVHLLMNLYWTALFGAVVERMRGSFRLLLMVLSISIFSNLAQFFSGGESFGLGGPMFGGISGVVFGLFGSLWFKTYFDRQQGIVLRPFVSWMFFVWMLLCMTPVVQGVANMSHVSGLVCGIWIAMTTKMFRWLLQESSFGTRS